MINEIDRTLRLFHPLGNVVEIRVLGIPGRGRPHIASGYFTDFREAARQAVRYDREKSPGGIYFTFNRLNPAVLARSPEKITEYASDTTSDRDVTDLQWLFFDIDPDRPKGVASSDAELEAARIVGQQVRDWLINQLGFPAPIEAMSGNGWHLMFPIDMPNSQAATERVKRALLDVASRFGGGNTPEGLPSVTVDTAVCNPGRLTKLYGTMPRKGHEIEGRPLRRSQIIHVPDALNISDIEDSSHDS
jgi:hypothetical protein